jgi:erythronate-4-phosphate dehydrogenase
MLVIVDDKIPFIKGILEPFMDVNYCEGRLINKTIVKNADALIVRTRTQCNAGLLEGSDVRFIATATIGYDHIDVDYCRNKGITWTNAAGSNSGSVMQYVAAALLTYANENNVDLKDHVLGVVGAGNVGKKVVRLAESIGMGVVINDPPRSRNEGNCGFVSIEGILREADMISFHVPLIKTGQDRTFHMIDDLFLEKINKGTLLINTSRGEVIDTQALKKSFGAGRLSTAILDVWENEPFIDKELLNSTFLGTPHIAGYSIDGKAKATTMAVNAISSFFNLGIEGWEPYDLPGPENTMIQYDAKDKGIQEILFDLVKLTYDIHKDDYAIKMAPDDFENFRGNYRVRREFSAYQIIAENLKDKDKIALVRAGFNIL